MKEFVQFFNKLCWSDPSCTLGPAQAVKFRTQVHRRGTECGQGDKGRAQCPNRGQLSDRPALHGYIIRYRQRGRSHDGAIRGYWYLGQPGVDQITVHRIRWEPDIELRKKVDTFRPSSPCWQASASAIIRSLVLLSELLATALFQIGVWGHLILLLIGRWLGHLGLLAAGPQNLRYLTQGTVWREVAHRAVKLRAGSVAPSQPGRGALCRGLRVGYGCEGAPPPGAAGNLRPGSARPAR